MKSAAYGFAILFFMMISFAAGWISKLVISGVSASTVIQSSTILATVFLAVWTYRAAKRKEAEARLFTQKAAVYEPLVGELKKLHMAGKHGHPEVNNEDLARALIDIQFKAIIWGDQAFLKALTDMSDITPDEPLDSMFHRVARLYEQMRRELGHSDKPGVGYDVMELLLIPKDRHLVRAMKAKVHNSR